MLVASEDSSYMPARVVVLGGDSPAAIRTELNAVSATGGWQRGLAGAARGRGRSPCRWLRARRVPAGDRAALGQPGGAAAERAALLAPHPDPGEALPAGGEPGPVAQGCRRGAGGRALSLLSLPQGGIDTRVRGIEVLGPKPSFWPVFKEQLCRRTSLCCAARAHAWGQEIRRDRGRLLQLFGR